jgi:Fe-S oxidoreductase
MQSVSRRVLVQTHCHQSALVGPEPGARLLRLVPDLKIVALDAGCCGMAGSFGYEAEHYEVSRLVGERRLFPALRASSADDIVVARILLPAPDPAFHRPSRRPSRSARPFVDDHEFSMMRVVE